MEQFTYHHIGIAVYELQATIREYSRSFNYKLLSGPFDDPVQNVSVCFLGRDGYDPLLELVAPLGVQSPLESRLKRGAGTYHLCYAVPNIRAAISHLQAEGALLLSEPVPTVAFKGREIAWLMMDSGLLVELLQNSLSDSS